MRRGAPSSDAFFFGIASYPTISSIPTFPAYPYQSTPIFDPFAAYPQDAAMMELRAASSSPSPPKFMPTFSAHPYQSTSTFNPSCSQLRSIFDLPYPPYVQFPLNPHTLTHSLQPTPTFPALPVSQPSFGFNSPDVRHYTQHAPTYSPTSQHSAAYIPTPAPSEARVRTPKTPPTPTHLSNRWHILPSHTEAEENGGSYIRPCDPPAAPSQHTTSAHKTADHATSRTSSSGPAKLPRPSRLSASPTGSEGPGRAWGDISSEIDFSKLPTAEKDTKKQKKKMKKKQKNLKRTPPPPAVHRLTNPSASSGPASPDHTHHAQPTPTPPPLAVHRLPDLSAIPEPASPDHQAQPTLTPPPLAVHQLTDLLAISEPASPDHTHQAQHTRIRHHHHWQCINSPTATLMSGLKQKRRGVCWLERGCAGVPTARLPRLPLRMV